MTAAGAQVLRLLILAIAATFRPKALLIAENPCLRQQLVVLQRRHPRRCLRNADRHFWIQASRWFSDWRNPLLIVKPKTVLGWQRAGWRAYWRWRSSRQARGGRPAIRGELQALIGRMAAENRLWVKAHPGRISKVRVSGFRQDRGQIYASVSQPRSNRDVARVPDAACIGHLGLRLFLRPDGPVPDASRLLRHPTRKQRDPPR
jgi:hypothetical protein